MTGEFPVLIVTTKTFSSDRWYFLSYTVHYLNNNWWKKGALFLPLFLFWFNLFVGCQNNAVYFWTIHGEDASCTSPWGRYGWTGSILTWKKVTFLSLQILIWSYMFQDRKRFTQCHFVIKIINLPAKIRREILWFFQRFWWNCCS